MRPPRRAQVPRAWRYLCRGSPWGPRAGLGNPSAAAAKAASDAALVAGMSLIVRS